MQKLSGKIRQGGLRFVCKRWSRRSDIELYPYTSWWTIPATLTILENHSAEIVLEFTKTSQACRHAAIFLCSSTIEADLIYILIHVCIYTPVSTADINLTLFTFASIQLFQQWKYWLVYLFHICIYTLVQEWKLLIKVHMLVGYCTLLWHDIGFSMADSLQLPASVWINPWKTNVYVWHHCELHYRPITLHDIAVLHSQVQAYFRAPVALEGFASWKHIRCMKSKAEWSERFALQIMH